MPVRILVTGGAGYIGSVLCRRLLAKGHELTVLDALFFGDRGIRELAGHPGFRLVEGDIRRKKDINKALGGAEAIIHLAALVGEPAAERWPELNRSINLDGTRNLLELTTDRLFVYASSCSVYGNQDGIVDEESPVMALGPYAESRILGEEMVREMAEQYLILRFATVFGLSRRMRFDLLVNEFALSAWRSRVIEIYNPGIIRPFVHLSDLANAIAVAVSKPEARGQTINMGMGNFSKAEIAGEIAGLAGAEVKEVKAGPDLRNYTISFERMEKLLGVRAKVGIREGAREILAALKNGEFPDPDDPVYHNHSPVYH